MKRENNIQTSTGRFEIIALRLADGLCAAGKRRIRHEIPEKHGLSAHIAYAAGSRSSIFADAATADISGRFGGNVIARAENFADNISIATALLAVYFQHCAP